MRDAVAWVLSWWWDALGVVVIGAPLLAILHIVREAITSPEIIDHNIRINPYSHEGRGIREDHWDDPR
jgi:hypothetical protein